jgi:hypothetical protein
MTDRLVRSQILLSIQQRRRLEAIARREGKSISAVTRQVIDAGLQSMENQTETWKKREQVLAALRGLREQQPEIYPGDLVDEIRQERENEDMRLWGSPSS